LIGEKAFVWAETSQIEWFQGVQMCSVQLHYGQTTILTDNRVSSVFHSNLTDVSASGSVGTRILLPAAGT